MLLSSTRFPLHDTLFDVLRASRPAPSTPSWRRQEDRFVLEVLAAGLAPSDVKVQQEGRIIEVSLGQHGVLHARLPQAADAQTLSATLSRGVLSLSLDIQAASLPRRIEVREIHEANAPAIVSSEQEQEQA